MALWRRCPKHWRWVQSVQLHCFDHVRSTVSGHTHLSILHKLPRRQRIFKPMTNYFPSMIVRKITCLKAKTSQFPFCVNIMGCKAHVRLKSTTTPQVSRRRKKRCLFKLLRYFFTFGEKLRLWNICGSATCILDQQCVAFLWTLAFRWCIWEPCP